MTTPQRALELAYHFERFDKASIPYSSMEETAKILRHYAEIMQAEPVAVLHTDWADTYLKIFTGRLYGDDKALIIKPEPLK